MSYGQDFWSQKAPSPVATKAPPTQNASYGSQFWGAPNKSADLMQTHVATIPSWLGGGAYNIGQNKNEVINTGHTDYGGLPSKQGFQRNDVVPVGLGGNNSSPDNVRYQPQDQATTQDPIEKDVINQYKDGKLTLAQARLKIMTVRQQADNPQPSGVKNFFSSIKYSPLSRQKND